MREDTALSFVLLKEKYMVFGLSLALYFQASGHSVPLFPLKFSPAIGTCYSVQS